MWNQSRIGGTWTSASARTPRSPGQPSVKAVSTVSLVPPTALRFFLIIANRCCRLNPDFASVPCFSTVALLPTPQISGAPNGRVDNARVLASSEAAGDAYETTPWAARPQSPAGAGCFIGRVQCQMVGPARSPHCRHKLLPVRTRPDQFGSPRPLCDTQPGRCESTRELDSGYIAIRPALGLFSTQGFQASLLSAEKNSVLPESCKWHWCTSMARREW
jgi:hypothetical protein